MSPNTLKSVINVYMCHATCPDMYLLPITCCDHKLLCQHFCRQLHQVELDLQGGVEKKCLHVVENTSNSGFRVGAIFISEVLVYNHLDLEADEKFTFSQELFDQKF